MVQTTAVMENPAHAARPPLQPRPGSWSRPGRAAVWPLTGRTKELRALAGLLDEVGHCRGVVLAGAAGVGKTRLAREALAMAGRRGATTRWASATSSAASIPLGALAHVLPPLRSGGDAEGFGSLHHAIDAVRDLGGERPVVLAIDDGHRLDDASATLVHQIAMAGAATLVVTLRNGERAPDPIVALWKDELVPRLDLGPLCERDVSDLVSTFLQGVLDPAAAARFWRLSLGNCLFLREVALGALEAGQLTDRTGVWRWAGGFSPTSRLTELVRARLGRLPSEQRDLIELVAFGEPLGAGLLTNVFSEETLRNAERDGVVTLEREGRRWLVRLPHPLYAEVVKAECSPMRARDARRALVAAQSGRLRRRGDVLRHAILQTEADGTGEPSLLSAAAVEAGPVDPKAAERMARAALASGGGFSAQLALGLALRYQGEPFRAEKAVAQASAMASTDWERVEAAVHLGKILFWARGDPDLADAVLDEALAASADPAVTGPVIALRASFCVFRGRPQAAVEMASALVASDATPDRALVHASIVLSHALARCGRFTDATAASERARAAMEECDSADVCLESLAHAELTTKRLSGPLQDARQRAAAFYDHCSALPAEAGLMPIARLLDGQIALAAGRPATAARQLEAVVVELGDESLGAWLYWALLGWSEALALTGDPSGARTALTRADQIRRDTVKLWEPDFLVAEAWVLASEGELSRAVASARSAASSAATTGQSSIEVLALHACVRLGHREEAIADRLQVLGQKMDSALAKAAGDHAAAFVAGDGSRLDRAAQSFADAGAFLVAAEAFHHAATAHRNAGIRARQLASWRRADELREECEGARTPALEEPVSDVALTRREREVAGLAARGNTSRAIAERLVVSVRTVENHLDSAYTKLGVHNREDLAIALGFTRGLTAS